MTRKSGSGRVRQLLKRAVLAFLMISTTSTTGCLGGIFGGLLGLLGGIGRAAVGLVGMAARGVGAVLFGYQDMSAPVQANAPMYGGGAARVAPPPVVQAAPQNYPYNANRDSLTAARAGF